MCLAAAWIIFLSMAVMGMTVHWPSWLMLGVNTGIMAAARFIRARRAYGVFMLAMGILAMAAAIGTAVARQ
jgi:hypothetical protein